jgi:hypothetical protein
MNSTETKKAGCDVRAQELKDCFCAKVWEVLKVARRHEKRMSFEIDVFGDDQEIWRKIFKVPEPEKRLKPSKLTQKVSVKGGWTHIHRINIWKKLISDLTFLESIFGPLFHRRYSFDQRVEILFEDGVQEKRHKNTPVSISLVQVQTSSFQSEDALGEQMIVTRTQHYTKLLVSFEIVSLLTWTESDEEKEDDE